jgi:hypothetical protein
VGQNTGFGRRQPLIELSGLDFLRGGADKGEWKANSRVKPFKIQRSREWMMPRGDLTNQDGTGDYICDFN